MFCQGYHYWNSIYSGHQSSPHKEYFTYKDWLEEKHNYHICKTETEPSAAKWRDSQQQTGEIPNQYYTTIIDHILKHSINLNSTSSMSSWLLPQNALYVRSCPFSSAV